MELAFEVGLQSFLILVNLALPSHILELAFEVAFPQSRLRLDKNTFFIDLSNLRKNDQKSIKLMKNLSTLKVLPSKC